MNKKEKTIFTNNLDEIDTADSYFGKIFIQDSKMLIPYINLGISNHELNPEKKLKYIDFSYLVLDKINYLKINNTKELINDRCIDGESLYFGGSSLYDGNEIIEFEVQARHVFLQIAEEARISENLWIPRITPVYEPNLDLHMVRDFSDGKMLPDNLTSFFKA